jgi:glycosyltransferase involved in cell wall biosynthesis
MNAPLKVLCLDIEGGHGGSSRSLYFSLKHVDRDLIAPTVVCRRGGVIVERYQALGIPVHVMPHLPKANPVPRLSRNLIQVIDFASDIWRHRAEAQALNTLVLASDLIHFNHEGFAWLAAYLWRRHRKPATMHLRTNVANTIVTRLQARVITHHVDAVVCITKNEETTFRAHGGAAPTHVVYNIVEPTRDVTPLPTLPRDGRFIVSMLANAAVVRGTDRLFELAAAFEALGRRDILLAIAGNAGLSGAWPTPLDRFASAGLTLADAVRDLGLESKMSILGHQPVPEAVLKASDLVIKPSREGNPWGRDVIEAMACGLPVAATGLDKTFVEDGVTGILRADWDPLDMARAIAELADDRERARRMGATARARVLALCNGPSRAADLAAIWRRVAAPHTGRT